MFKIVFIFIGLLSFFSNESYAVVDLKNANYTNTWIDLDVSGSGYDLKIIRTYNSRSLFNGIFGFGWCSEFETSMDITAEGSLKIKECGGGQEIVYSPKPVSETDIEKSVVEIMKRVKQDPKNKYSANRLVEIQKDLKTDDDFRSRMAKYYGYLPEIKEGTKYFASGREVENITYNKNHYTRTLADGTLQRYSLDGKLTHIYDKNNNYLKFEYEKGILKTVADNNGKTLTFKYYQNNKVKEILGPNGLVVEYKFSNLDNLASVKNAWKNTFTYEYDELHNLTKATWPDKTFISIKYDKEKDWVIGFADRDKCTESYKYEPREPSLHFWSTVVKICGKEKVADNKYEFWYKKRNTGETFLQRVMTVISGSTTDIVYDEVHGKPTSIRRNSERLNFTYYPNGLVKTKSSQFFTMSYEHDTQFNKISKVSTELLDDKGKKVGTKVTEFKYDSKGNLIFAQNSDGQKINMTYDLKGRIATITDQAKKIVKIEYDDKYGKPAIVTRPGLGTIKVSYKPSGEINKVDSNEGPSVAMQVASTFNNLLDILAPASADVYL